MRLFIFGEKKDPLDLENRNPTKMPIFSKESFFDGTFQKKSEEALADQTPMSETIRSKYQVARNEIYKKLSWLSRQQNSNYRLVSDEYYVYKDYDYLVAGDTESRLKALYNLEPALNASFDYYDGLPIKKKYQYIATNDTVLNFDHIDYTALDWYKSKYPTFKQSYLNIPDFETYMRYYLKNDHHWNYEGSYQGYKDIISLILGPNEKVKKPAEKIVFNYNVIGSRSRPYISFHENFTAYRFEYKKHSTYVNGIKTEYGRQSEYFTNEELRNGEGDMFYGNFYGPDVSTVEFDFNQPEKENLIIIGFSYTNALNELVASHFNKTWVLDTRFSDRKTLEEILSKNKIENLLLLPNASAYIPVMPEEAKGYDS